MDLEEALKAKRYEEPYPLQFRIPPNQLMDKEYCEQLIKDLETKFAAKWEHFTAHSNLSLRIPDLPGLYMFVWKPFFSFSTEDGVKPLRMIVYIGKAGGPGSSSTLKSRYSGEYAKIVGSNPLAAWDQLPAEAGRDQKLNLYLNIHELEFWFLALNDIDSIAFIDMYEKRLIKMINPPCNVEYLRAKLSKIPQPAF